MNLLSDLKEYCIENNLIVQNADKNAGICIMDKNSYDREVINMLSDTQTYFPSTKTHYVRSIDDFTDRVKCFENFLAFDFKLSNLIPDNPEPSNFYILPKIHKKFEKFPKGRPISSTIHTYNKPISKLLDSFLQPIMLFIPDLLLDTTHFLTLLNNVKLEPNEKYTLVTVDIVSLYTNLITQNCKSICCNYYKKYKNDATLPNNITVEQLRTLLDLSLDFSFVKYDKEYFYQYKGIQMGGSASCSIANITVFEELKEIFDNLEVKDKIVFRKRFLDDIF